ncbi:MAG: site-2 protease family protein [Candidatus Taylorbacteria bacterium]|nr:site-2 protease family protein [Candidatus Taylorbacteria bacterium]
MNIIIFLVILALLVLVHEFGHFIVAKKNGVRVDEFGLGFPPRIFGKKIGETVYSLNLVPFGGFVKIFGENAESLETPEGTAEDPSRSLAHKSHLVQAAVLGAGVSFNVLFAWLVISLGLIFGLPTIVDNGNALRVSDSHVIINLVMPKSPAEEAGLKTGDILLALKAGTASLTENLNPDAVRDFIASSKGPISFLYKQGSKVAEAKILPREGIVSGAPAIGISMDMVGILKLPAGTALLEGGVRTAQLFKTVTWSIAHFLRDALVGRADLAQVAGPVGMVALVGDARDLGFAYLVFFTALLSINLAVINLLPFPALDGGRLVMVAIEAAKGSPLKPRFVQTLNAVGFALLIFLMLAVTYHDILKLF